MSSLAARLPSHSEDWVEGTVAKNGTYEELGAQNTAEIVSPPNEEVGGGPVSSSSPGPTFNASVSTSTAGTSVRLIPPDALQIVARWRARNVPEHSSVRAVWIAEDTGGTAAPDYHVDEAHADVPGTGGTGAFTLSRPPDGWAEGRYRVEFYLNENLAATIKLTIGEDPSPP